jgi:hypothetical protein
MRHEPSNYDDLLDEFVGGGRLDDWDAYTTVRTRVEHALEEAYRAVGYSYTLAKIVIVEARS